MNANFITVCVTLFNSYDTLGAFFIQTELILGFFTVKFAIKMKKKDNSTVNFLLFFIRNGTEGFENSFKR